jgi:Protein of unknown function (DUF2628)
MTYLKTTGWNWAAFAFGPFWYLSSKMYVKGGWLLFLVIITAFLAIPFVMVYCGSRGQGDLYNYQLKKASKIDIHTL